MIRLAHARIGAVAVVVAWAVAAAMWPAAASPAGQAEGPGRPGGAGWTKVWTDTLAVPPAAGSTVRMEVRHRDGHLRHRRDRDRDRFAEQRPPGRSRESRHHGTGPRPVMDVRAVIVDRTDPAAEQIRW